MQVAQHGRRIPGLIAWCRVLLFVAGIMLLIHHDETEVGERKENGTARANHQTPPALPGGHPPISGGALPGTEPAVVDFKPVTEEPAKAHDELGRQGNFRNEEQSIAPSVQYFVNQMGVDLRLAGTGDPFEQHQA